MLPSAQTGAAPLLSILWKKDPVLSGLKAGPGDNIVLGTGLEKS